jgi:hypothetical protein
LVLKLDAMIMNYDVFTEFTANNAIKKATIAQYQVFRSKDDAVKWIIERIKD